MFARVRALPKAGFCPTPLAGPFALLIAAAFLTAIAPPAVGGTVTITPLVRIFDSGPGGDGTFQGFTTYGAPCINDSGQVTFSAQLTGNAGGSAADEVLVRAAESQPTVLLAREGQSLPFAGTLGQLNIFPRPYSMNNLGLVAFTAHLNGTSGGVANDQGLFTSDGPGTLALHVRKGDIPPFTSTPFNFIYPAQINNQSPADLCFYGSLGGATATPSPIVVYLENGTSLDPVSWWGQAAPDGNGTVVSYADPDQRPAVRPNAHEAAFGARMGGTALGSLDAMGVYQATSGSMVQVARGHGAACVALNNGFTSPIENIMGRSAYVANLNPSSAGQGLMLGTDCLVHSGTMAPDSNGTFDAFGRPEVSAGNLTAFRADLKGTLGGTLDDSGIYRADPLIVYQVAHENQDVPEGGGQFSVFGNIVAINAAAHVVFTATLRNTPNGSSDNFGVYMWDEFNGLTKLLRTGDLISGAPVLGISTLSGHDYGGFRSLNDFNEVVAVVQASTTGNFKDGVYILRGPAAVLGVSTPASASRARLDVSPNPAGSGGVSIHYALGAPSAGPLKITAYDSQGRAVRTVLSVGAGAAGGTVRWDGRGDDGRPAASGVYYLRLQGSAGVSAVRRIVRFRSGHLSSHFRVAQVVHELASAEV